MISPQAVRLIVRHFDAVDQAVSKRTTRKRPWLEPGITSYLCDLMDDETQVEESLAYTIADLNRDLAGLDGLLDLTLSVQTHEYPPQLERFVTQADLGFIIRIEDHLLPQESRSVPWLLQAKRFQPDSRNPLRYSETSRVGAIDARQHERMRQLSDVLGHNVVRYIFYGPRPEFLDDVTRQKLLHLRRRHLGQQIFDYTLGLELHAEVDRAESTLAAGIFIAGLDRAHSSLGEIHRFAFASTLPLSWFIVAHFFSSGPGTNFGFDKGLHREGREPRSGDPDLARGVVTGDLDAISRLLNLLGDNDQGRWPVLPQHTIEVRLGVGTRLNPDQRRIRIEG